MSGPPLDASSTSLLRESEGPRAGWLRWLLPEGLALRLDRALHERFPSWSRRLWQRAIQRDWVLLDGKTVRPSRLVRGGQRVHIHPDLPRLEGREEGPEPPSIPVLLDEGSVLVVHKPAGYLVHSSSPFHRDALVDRLQEERGETLHTVHRLDRLSSGILLFARSVEGASFLREAFEARSCRKLYLAVVEGLPPLEGGEICSALGPLPEAPVPGMQGLVENGRPCRSSWFRLDAWEGRSLLSLELHTGRKHQLRVHLASRGWPIVGERLYGDGPDEDWYGGGGEPDGTGYRAAWHGLHAWRLSFPHPDDGRLRHVVAPPRAAFRDLLMEIATRGEYGA